MFERKIHVISDKKKILKYLCIKSILPTLIIVLGAIVVRLLGNMMLEKIGEDVVYLDVWQVIIFIVLTFSLFFAFVLTYSKKYKFSMVKLSEEAIILCYEDNEIIYKLDEIYLEKKKKVFKIVLKKNKQKFSIPLFMLKNSDYKNILTDMKKFNVKIRR